MGIEMVLVLVAAFLCEMIDSSLGMLYGTILSPVLIIAGFDPLMVVPSILFSQAIGGIIASNGLPSWNLLLVLTAGAIVGAIIGPHITAKFKSEKKLRLSLGILVTLLGIWTLVKTWLI